MKRAKTPKLQISLLRGKEEATPRRQKTTFVESSKEDKIIRPKTALPAVRPMSSYSMQSFVRSSRLFESRPSMIKPTKVLQESKRKIVTDPDEWVKDYVRNKLSHSAAIKIQRCWRTYALKKQWGGLFHRRIWLRKDALLRIFVAWRGYTTKNFSVIVDCYNRFARFQLEKKWINASTNLAPFSIFYLTDSYFLPHNITPRQYAFIARVFAHPESKFILKLWKFAAHTQKVFREKSLYFFFTVKKRTYFGFTFSAFHLWHLYTVWRRKTLADPSFNHIEQSEVMIDWNVREKFLRKAKGLRVTANNAFTRNLKKRALIAIHQRLVEKRQLTLDIDSSGQFYLHHLMEMCRKAWVHFVFKQRARRQELLRLQKIWYTTAYDMALQKMRREILTTFHSKTFISQVFTQWKKAARVTRIRALINAFKMQRKPSLPRQFVLKLYGLHSLVTFEQVFHEWINFARKRRNWKQFLGLVHSAGGELESKQIAFCGLRKLIEYHAFKRVIHDKNAILPNLAAVPVEGLIKYFGSGQKTDNKDGQDGYEIIRIFLVCIDQARNASKISIKNICDRKESKDEQKHNDILSMNEITSIYSRNCKQLYDLMRMRIARDSIVVSGLATHTAALELRKVLPFFVTYQTDEFLKFPNMSSCPMNIYLTPNAVTSLEQHKRTVEISQKMIPPEIIRVLVDGKQEFKARMRPPIIIYGDSTSIFENSVEMFSNDAIAAVDSKREMSIPGQPSQSNFKPKEIRASVTPYVRPNLSDYTPPHKNLFLTVIKENMGIRNPSSTGLSGSLAEFAPSFTSEVMIQKLSNCEAYPALRRFFTSSAQIRLDMKVTDTNAAESQMTATQRRTMRRNINAFYAGMLNIDASKTVPMDIVPPQWLKNISDAVIACHYELRKFQSVFAFCADIPFPRKFLVDDDANVDLRSMIYTAVTKKFPKLAKTESAIKREDSQEMTRTDLYVAMLAVPYIFKSEYVADFLKDEIRIDQIRHENERPL